MPGLLRPVPIPCLLGEGRTLRGNALLVGGFLGGRLIGYLAFALIAWTMHIAFVESLPHRTVITGVIDVNTTGGTADANGVNASADAHATAYGICAPIGSLTNSGQINARASGGNAVSGSTEAMEAVDTTAQVYALFAEDGAIGNTAAVSAIATRGNATGTAIDNHAEVSASAWAYAYIWITTPHILMQTDTSPTAEISPSPPLAARRSGIPSAGSSKPKAPAYDGEYSPDAQRHNVWLRFSWLLQRDASFTCPDCSSMFCDRS